MRFSERMGIKKPKELIQIDSMDDDLRNGLWNSILHTEKLIKDELYTPGSLHYSHFTTKISLHIKEHFFKRPLDEIELSFELEQSSTFFREAYFGLKWFEVYDYLEFLETAFRTFISDSLAKEFILLINETLKKENSGYRFIGNSFARITNETEILEIEKVLENSENYLLRGVNTHFVKSLKMLSDKQNPDYQNSLKESISAVESICKIISGKPSATLNDALRHIEKNKKVNLHKALKAGFDKFYAYAGDKGGVRHSSIGESDLDFEDAKFMLVSCSAFVNYLIVKADKAGIELTSN